MILIHTTATLKMQSKYTLLIISYITYIFILSQLAKENLNPNTKALINCIN